MEVFFMKTLTLVLGILGAICLVIGIITAADLIPQFGDAFTWIFWLGTSAVLFLASISTGVLPSSPGE